MDPLKLIALDHEDLAIISAHLQDAVLKVADMVFLPGERRFALVANRFDWEGAAGGLRRRRRAGLSFARVLNARIAGFDLKAGAMVLNLLAVTFRPTDAPSGVVELVFSGGAGLRLEVECLEAQLSDLGPTWESASIPAHETGGDTQG